MKKVTFGFLLFLACLIATFGQTPGTGRFPTALDTSVSLLEVQDRASTTLNGAITSGATTITVTSTSLFPATGTLTIDDERLYYTAKTATTFTVVRGQFSSTAAAHSNGATVRMNVMAIHHTVIRDMLIAVETKLGYSASTPTTTGHVLTVTGAGTTAWQAPSVTSILPVVDTQTIIKGSADATKLIRFEADGITTGTTRVITAPDSDTTLPIFSQIITFTGPTAARTVTLPDASFTVVGLTQTQSLTNKTLAGSTNTITPIDTNFTITGSADLTKIVRFEIDGFTTGTTRVVTVPDANIVMAGSAAALTSGRVPFVTTGGLLTDSSNLQFDSANIRFGIGGTPTGTIHAQKSDTPDLRLTETSSSFVARWGVDDGSNGVFFSSGGSASNHISFWPGDSTPTALFHQNKGTMFAGSTSGLTPGAQVDIRANAASVKGLTVRGAASQTANLLELQNSSATVLTAFNSAGELSTFAGIADAVNLIVGSTTGTKIATSTSQKLGFWNATPIVQPSSTGQTAGYTANVTANILYDASTYTGGVGSTAYTIGDIVKHLKNIGLIAQ